MSDDFNPADHLARLHEIAEEIPSGVSEVMMTSILPHPKEIFTATNNTIVNAIKENIDIFWNNCKVAEKLQNLKVLEKQTASTEKAWRPTTGQVDLKPVYANVLRERKEILEKEIRKTKEKSDCLKLCLNDYKEKYDKYIMEINAWDFDDVDDEPEARIIE